VTEWHVDKIEKRLCELYKTQCREADVEGEAFILYGVSDEIGFYIDFTTDKKLAERFANLLNANDVEACHVPEIIEDFFYSCMDKDDI